MNNVLSHTLEAIFSSYNIRIRFVAIFVAKRPDLRGSNGYSIDYVPRLSLKISGRLEGYIPGYSYCKKYEVQTLKSFLSHKSQRPTGLTRPLDKYIYILK